MYEAAHICSRNCIGHGQGGTLEIVGRALRVRNHISETPKSPIIIVIYYHLFSLSFIFIIIIIIIVIIIIIIIIICSRHQEGVPIVLPQEAITYFHLYY